MYHDSLVRCKSDNMKYINVNSLLVNDPFPEPESSFPVNIIGRRMVSP